MNFTGGDVVQRLIQECGLRCCSPDFFDVGYLADEIRNSANSSKLMVILLRTTEHKSNRYGKGKYVVKIHTKHMFRWKNTWQKYCLFPVKRSAGKPFAKRREQVTITD